MCVPCLRPGRGGKTALERHVSFACQMLCKLTFALLSCLCLPRYTGMHIFCLTASLVLAHAFSTDLITRFPGLMLKKQESKRGTEWGRETRRMRCRVKASASLGSCIYGRGTEPYCIMIRDDLANERIMPGLSGAEIMGPGLGRVPGIVKHLNARIDPGSWLHLALSDPGLLPDPCACFHLPRHTWWKVFCQCVPSLLHHV